MSTLKKEYGEVLRKYKHWRDYEDKRLNGDIIKNFNTRQKADMLYNDARLAERDLIIQLRDKTGVSYKYIEKLFIDHLDDPTARRRLYKIIDKAETPKPQKVKTSNKLKAPKIKNSWLVKRSRGRC